MTSAINVAKTLLANEEKKANISGSVDRIASKLVNSNAYKEYEISRYNDDSKSFYEGLNALYGEVNGGAYKQSGDFASIIAQNDKMIADTQSALSYFKNKDEKTYSSLQSELNNLTKIRGDLDKLSAEYGKYKDEADFRVNNLYNVPQGSEGTVADTIRDVAFREVENKKGGSKMPNFLGGIENFEKNMDAKYGKESKNYTPYDAYDGKYKYDTVITEDGMVAMGTLLAKEGLDYKTLLAEVKSSAVEMDDAGYYLGMKIAGIDTEPEANKIIREALLKYGFTDKEITMFLSTQAYINESPNETDENGNVISTTYDKLYKKIDDKIHSEFWTDAILSAVAAPSAVVGGVFAAADLVGQNVAAAFDDKYVIGYNTDAQYLTNATNQIKGSIADKLGGVGGFFYQTGMSIAESSLAMLVSAGIGSALGSASAAGGTMSFAQAAQKAPWVSGVLLGSSAGATTTQSFKAMGYTDSEAFAMGVLAGTAESVFETWSLEKLLGDTINKLTKASLTEVGVKRLLKQTGAILGQALCEGSEELATEVANAMSEVFVLGVGNTTMDAAMQTYIDQGESFHDAHWKALLDKGVDILLAFVGGAISGGVMGGGAFAMDSAQQMALKLQYHRDYLKGVTALEKVLDNNVAMSKLRTKLATSFQTTGDKLIDSHINAIVKAGNDENVLRTEYAKVGAEPEVREAALLISIAAQKDTKNNETLAADISSVLGVTVTAEDLATNRGGIATIYASYLYFDGLTVSGKKAVIDRAIARTEKFLDEQIKKNKDSVQGRIYYGEVDKSKFDALRKHSVRAIENLANVLDVNVVFFDSSVKGNMKVNGFLDRSTNTVYLDINSGNNAEGVMLFTMAHELVHFMKQESANSYKVLEQFLIDTYGKDKMNTLINEQITKAKQYGDNMTPEAALEEVICDFAARMLADKKVLTDFARLSNKHKGLAEKIKSFFADSETKLEEMYSKFEADTPEAYELSQLGKGSLEAFRDVFEKSLLDTAVAYRSKKKDGKIGTIDLNAYKEARDEKGDLVFRYQDHKFSRKLREISTVTEEEYKTMESHFGTTGNFKVAGYLLPDGKLLDFSGKHWGDTTSRTRQVDHRDIGEVLDRGNNGVADMIDMIGSGSIRLMPEVGGINLATYPNEKQRKVLSLYIRQMLATEGQVIIDFDEVGGDTVHSRIYEKNATSSRILGDIRNYFNGARQSDLMAFHTSDSDYVYSRKRLDNNAQGEYNSSDGYDSYYQNNTFMKEVEYQDRSAFSRSLANNTSNIKSGEIKIVKIYAPHYAYVFEADGYMQGKIVYKISTNDREKWDKINEVLKNDYRQINSDSASSDVWTKTVEYVGGGYGDNYDELGRGGGSDGNDSFLSEPFEGNGTRHSEKNVRYYHPEEEVNEILRKLRELADKDKAYSRKATDSAYLDAVKRGDMETAQKMVDEAAKANGYDKLFYHGAKKGGGFTEFRDWSYFTENKQYAERYTERDNKDSLYTTYVKLENPFDTRNTGIRAIFDKIRQEYGLSEIQDTGLPDWTDGYDISDYIDENELDYDGIILDEGGDLVNGKPVSRGASYVIRKSAQIKSADPVTYDDDGNIIPLSERFNPENEDIRFSRKYTPEDARAAIERVKSGEVVEAPKVKNIKSMTPGTLKKFISEMAKEKRYSKEVAKEVARAFEGISSLKPDDVRNIIELIWEGLNDFSDSGYKKVFAKDMAKFYVSKLIEEQSTINIAPDKVAVETVNAVKSGIHKLTFTEENRAELRHVLGEEGFKRFLGRWGNKQTDGAKYSASQFVVDFAREHADLVGNENLESMSVEDALIRIDEIYSTALRNSKSKNTVAEYLDSEEYENYIAKILTDIETAILDAYETKGKDTYFGYVEKQLYKEREKMTAINRITRLLDRFEHQSRANKADFVYTDIVNGLKLFKAYQGKRINVDNVKAYAEKLEAFVDKLFGAEAQTVSGENGEAISYDAFDSDKSMIDDEAKAIIKALKNIDTSNIGEGERDLTLDEYRMLNDTLGLVARITASFGNEYIDGKWQSNVDSVNAVIDSSTEAYNKNKSIENVLKSKSKRTLKEQYDTPTDYINFIFGSRESNLINRYVNDIVRAADDMRAEYIKLIRPYEQYLADGKYFNRLYKEEVSICGEKITIGEFISLYCTSKREQAHSGLVGKNTVFGNANEKSTSKLPGRKLRNIMLGNDIKEVKANIQKAYESLNDKDKAFIKLVEEFFNEISTYIKTAADLKYFGYTNAQDEDYYFPISREGSGRDIASVYVGAISVVKQSFNHSINKHASGALHIDNVFDVVTKHLDGLMQYKHMFVPVQNFSKLFGKNIAEKGKNAETVLKMLEKNTGSSTVQYIRDWLANVQGKSTAKRDITTFKKFLATSSLGFNLQSVAKQNASLYAMMVEATPEVALSILEQPVFKVLNKDDMTKYSSVASYRIHDNAPYSAAIGKVSSDIIPKTGLEEFGAAFNDKATSFLRWGDQRVTYAMWSACQRIVARKQRLKLNTVENLVAAGKLLDEMINKYNDTTSNALRPLAIREGGWYSVWSMFASQPIKLWSSATRYANDMKTAKLLGDEAALKDARRGFKKASHAILLQAVWTTLVTAIFAALARKGLPKDEDEITAHVIGVTYVTEVIGVMPIIGDVINVVLEKMAGEYTYDIGGDAMSEYYNNIASLVYTVGQAFQGKGDLAEGRYKKVFELVASLAGVPVRNIYKYSTILTANIDKIVNKTSTYIVDYYYSGYAPTIKDLKNAAKKDSRYAETMLEILASKRMGKKAADSDLTSYTIEELLRLYKAEIKKGEDGDLNFLLPSSVPSKYTSAEAKKYYTVMDKAYGFANNLLGSAKYRTLDDEQRTDAISSVWSIYNDAAKVNATQSAASVPQAARYMIVTSGEKSTEIYVLAKAYEKAYNNATKQEKAKMKPIATYFAQLCREYGVSNEQRVILAAALGIGSTNDIKNAVKKKAESKGITIISSKDE